MGKDIDIVCQPNEPGSLQYAVVGKAVEKGSENRVQGKDEQSYQVGRNEQQSVDGIVQDHSADAPGAEYLAS
jgi:hypothetical protein